MGSQHLSLLQPFGLKETHTTISYRTTQTLEGKMALVHTQDAYTFHLEAWLHPWASCSGHICHKYSRGHNHSSNSTQRISAGIWRDAYWFLECTGTTVPHPEGMLSRTWAPLVTDRNIVASQWSLGEKAFIDCKPCFVEPSAGSLFICQERRGASETLKGRLGLDLSHRIRGSKSQSQALSC